MRRIVGQERGHEASPIYAQLCGTCRGDGALPAFKSLRGDFKFGVNNFPIQDFYLVKAAKRPDGKFQTENVEKVFKDDTDVYAKECRSQS